MSLETAKPKAIELYSPQYFAACTVGGALACGYAKKWTQFSGMFISDMPLGLGQRMLWSRLWI